jgi:hypothetical protein
MDVHGYVYAFAHQSNGWIKVGMTEKNDPQHCRDRIKHYIKQHRLPEDGWQLVSFIATPKARELETKVHRSLKKFRVMRDGERTELFHCSVITYLATLTVLEEFIDQSQSGQEYVHHETEPERIAREARYVRSEQARIRRAIDDEWLAKGVLLSKHNRFEREMEFMTRWDQHPIARARREAEKAEWIKQAAEAEKRRQRQAAEAEKRRQGDERERFIVEANRQRAEAEKQAQRISSRLLASFAATIAEWTRPWRELAERRRLKRSAKRTLNAALGRDARGNVRGSVSHGSGSFGLDRTESYLETLKSAAVPLLVAAVILAVAFYIHVYG